MLVFFHWAYTNLNFMIHSITSSDEHGLRINVFHRIWKQQQESRRLLLPWMISILMTTIFDVFVCISIIFFESTVSTFTSFIRWIFLFMLSFFRESSHLNCSFNFNKTFLVCFMMTPPVVVKHSSWWQASLMMFLLSANSFRDPKRHPLLLLTRGCDKQWDAFM